MTAACPACSVGDIAAEFTPPGNDAAAQEIILSVPEIHCAGCIQGVERALKQTAGVFDARVNLSLKRVRVSATAALTPSRLIGVLSEAGFAASELDASRLDSGGDARGRAILLRLAIAGFAMMNVMLLSVAIWSGATDSTRDMFHWISAAIALPAAMFCAQPFFTNSWTALRARSLNMDVPISLAILLASAMSLYETVSGGEHAYFDAALSLTFFLLAGRYLDYRTRRVARSAAQDIAALEMPRVLRLEDGAQVETAVTDVEIGDRIFLPTGTRLPVDGQIVNGKSLMDRSMLTGESDPVAAQVGGQLCAGEINVSGPLELEVTAVGENTSLRRIAKLVELAENARTRYTSLADRAAQIYAPVVHLLAFAAFVVWTALTGDVRLSLNIAVAVLIITCPCALGLAVPAVMTAANGRLYRAGVLVKNETALERLADVDCVVFDKTGTLTTGQARINRADFTSTDLSILKALAAASAHPVAASIAASLNDIAAAELSEIVEVAGEGMQAKLGSTPVSLGRGTSAGPAFGVGDTRRTIEIAETLVPGATAAVSRLQKAGLPVTILSGDASEKAWAIGQELGIADVHGELNPEAKQDHLRAMIAAGKKPFMVGDGLNDTGALAQAHVSLAPASALDASRTAADLVLLNPSLAGLPDILKTASSAKRRILENFGVALTYNMISVPIALLGFATPLMAALAMSTSSIIVCVNALRLKGAR